MGGGGRRGQIGIAESADQSGTLISSGRGGLDPGRRAELIDKGLTDTSSPLISQPICLKLNSKWEIDFQQPPPAPPSVTPPPHPVHCNISFCLKDIGQVRSGTKLFSKTFIEQFRERERGGVEG